MAATSFLFDLDGTIWDSYPCYGAALSAALNCTQDKVISRLRAGENVVTLAGIAGLSNQRFTQLCRAVVGDLKLYPDVIETLDELAERELPLGVVTNMPQRLVTPLLSDLGIDNYFGSVVCAARKPSGSGVIRAMGQLGVRPDANVVYVGDSLSDARAAGRAGVSFAWAAYGYGVEIPPDTAVGLQRFSSLLNLL